MGKIKILGIETSCDETAVAIIEGKNKNIKIVSNIISSQINLHARYGGVVPEIAARAHIENIIPALQVSFKKNKTKLKDIDAIAVTTKPGLLVSLLIGICTAKSLAYSLQKPLIPIHHVKAHIYANFVNNNLNLPKFPLLCLVASGGHTSLILMPDYNQYKIIGETLDDAAGEAFDKAGRILNLPYPGGPNISKIAQKGNPEAFNFPRAWLEKSYNFSFSGLKTAVLYEVKKIKDKNKKLKSQIIADVAASFQKAIIDVLVEKTLQATRKYKVKSICLAGGVAANNELRKQFRKQCQKIKKSLYIPPKNLCTDNAVMVAVAGYFNRFLKKYQF